MGCQGTTILEGGQPQEVEKPASAQVSARKHKLNQCLPSHL